MQNKPLSEYGDLQSVHHMDKQSAADAEAAEALLQEEPAKLVVVNGPGNLYNVEWTKGDFEIPFSCRGSWNHKGKASEAIEGAIYELRAQADAVLASDLVVKQQAAADAEAIQAAKEVAAEKERIQGEIDKEREQMEAAAYKLEEAAKPVAKASKKVTTTKK